MQDLDEIDGYKTSFSVFVALFYLEMLYILLMTLTILNRMADSILYLSKKESSPFKTDVIIPRKYAQHLKLFQIEGIRFFHKQYILGNGAILNDDSGLGKTIQTILYISALQSAHSTLNTLILCNEDDLDHWLNHIRIWSSSAVSIFTKDSSLECITLSTIDNLSVLKDLEWSIIVVDDIDPTYITKKLIKFKCKFKIWLKKLNLMNDLKTLHDILNYINPNLNCTFKEFYNQFSVVDQTVLEAWKRRQCLTSYCKVWILRRTRNMVVAELPLENLNICFENLIHIQKNDTNNEIEAKSYCILPIVPSPLNPRIETILNLSNVNNQIKCKGTKDSTGLKIKRNKQPKEVETAQSEEVICLDDDEPTTVSNGCLLESIFTNMPKPKGLKSSKCTPLILDNQKGKLDKTLTNEDDSESNSNKNMHFKLLDDILFGPDKLGR